MTSDSNSASPPDDDDEAIDLTHPEVLEEGSSALSFSGRGGPHSGGSGVRSWEQLVRETAAEPDADDVIIGAAAPPDDVEAASDKDLLRQVLADEPPPSDIILKDPSKAELNLSTPGAEPPAAAFALPPDLAATRPGDSSVISRSLQVGPGQSGFTSDVWESSHVDLLRPGSPAPLSSGSLQRTEELDDPPLVVRPSGDSSQALLGAMPAGAEHDESSAVDLGSHAAIDLPFPLGLDSTVQSARRKPAPLQGPDSESGAVDLLASGDEFDLGLSDVNTTPSWEAAREELPPTVPMVPAGKARLMAWAGGGTAGLLAGVALCAGLWFAGLAPNQSAKPNTTPTAAPQPDLGDWPARVHAANQARDDEAKKTAAATAEAQRARDQLALATVQLTQAKTTAAQAKEARDRADALAAQVKQAEAAQAGLKDSVEKLTAGKATADTKLREVDASLTALRDRLALAEADAKAAKDRSEMAEAARKQSSAFAAKVAQRLGTAATTSPADVLAALDQALARPAGESVATIPTRPTASVLRTPEQAQRAVWAGVNAYRAGNFATAEGEFARLASSPEPTAIYWYYLGLAQWREHRIADAEASFRHGWALERASRPPPGEVDAAFERFDRADRDAVNQFRR